jgi:hypothetical protein
MIQVLAGLATLVATVILFSRFIPRDGQVHWLAKSIWAPYLSVVFTCGFAFGFALTVTGIVRLFA